MRASTFVILAIFFASTLLTTNAFNGLTDCTPNISTLVRNWGSGASIGLGITSVTTNKTEYDAFWMYDFMVDNYYYRSLGAPVWNLDNLAVLAGSMRGRDISALGGVPIYVQWDPTTANNMSLPVNYVQSCSDFWNKNVITPFSLQFRQINGTGIINCTPNDLETTTHFGRWWRMRIDCDAPPSPGSYILYKTFTIDFATYFPNRDKTLYPADSVTYQVTAPSNVINAVTITFSDEETPTVTDIAVPEVQPGDDTTISGVFRVLQTDGITESYITNSNFPNVPCNIGTFKSFEEPDDEDTYGCTIPSDTTAGLYNYTQTTIKGDSLVLKKSYLFNFAQNKTFQVAVHPTINSFSPNNGSTYGQIITIKGQGFNPNASSLNVSFAGKACSILSQNSTQIQCQLAQTAQSEANSTQMGSAGMLLETFSNYSSTLAALAKDSTTAANSSQYKIVSESIATTKTGIFQRLTGYFVAPISGNYKFYVCSQGASEAYIAASTTDNISLTGISGLSASLNNLTLIDKSNGTDTFRNFLPDLKTANLQLITVALNAGQSYLITVVHDARVAGSFVTLGSEVPSTENKAAFISTIQLIQLNYTYVPGQLYQGYCAQDNKTTFPMTFNASIYWTLGTGSTRGATGYIGNTTLFDPANPDVVEISRQLTILNDGRRISVTRFPTKWKSGSGSTSTLCVALGTGEAALQNGWGFTVTFLDPPIGIYANLLLNAAVNYNANNYLGYLYNGTYKLVGQNYTNTANALVWSKDPVTGVTLSGSLVIYGGNFTLSYKGISSGNLPYNIDEFTLRNIFASTFGLYVNVYRTGVPEIGSNWTIQFDNDPGDIESLQVSYTTFQGPKVGTTITAIDPSLYSMTSTKIQTGRTNMFLAPITGELLRVKVNKAEVIVHSDGLRSLLRQNDTTTQYTIISDAPNVTSVSLNGATVQVQVSYPASWTTPRPQNLTVTVSNQSCTNLVFNQDNFTCTLPAHADGSPVLPYGTTPVSVYLPSFGYYSPASLTTVAPTPTITSVTPNTGPPSGGTVHTIIGSGFSYPWNESATVVMVGGVIAPIVEGNTTYLKITLPDLKAAGLSDGPVSIDVNVSGLDGTFSGFSLVTVVDARTIDSVNVSSVSPVKSSIISGVLSGKVDTNIDNFVAQLAPVDPSTNSPIICYLINITSTSFSCVIAGGYSGTYQFQLIHNVDGTAVNSPTIQVRIYTLAVSVSSGSYLGGTKITIDGLNFSPVLNENQVYLGPDDAISSCDVISATTTELVCVTEGLGSNQKISTAYAVRVFGRLVEEATADPSLTFTFIDSGATIDSLSSMVVRQGDVLTIGGENLLADGETAQVLLGSYECTIIASNATEIQCTVPGFAETDSAALTLLTSVYGYIDTESRFVTNILEVTSVEPAVAGAKGNQFVINGNGLSNSLVYVNETLAECATLSQESNQIVCNVNTTFTANGTYTLVITGLTANLTSTFTVDVTRTPTVSSVGVSTAQGSATLTFNGLNLTDFGTDIHAYVRRRDNPLEGVVVSQGNTQVVAEFANLPAGAYEVILLVKDAGFAKFSGSRIVNISLPLPASHTVSTGFSGGIQVTYTGTGFSSSDRKFENVVTVCGLPATVTDSTTTSVTFEVPAIVTPDSQAQFGVGVSSRVFAASTFGNGSISDFSLINDGSVGLPYYDTNTKCEVGLDFGAGTYVDIESVAFYLDFTISSVSKVSGAQILGATDSGVYTPIVSLNDLIIDISGLNTYKLAQKAQYRYVKFVGGNCRVAELMVNGIQYANTTSTVASTPCDVSFQTGGSGVVTLPDEIRVSSGNTLVLTGVSPAEGSSAGGTPITITGSNFGTDATELSVTINGVACQGLTLSTDSTQITCTTGGLSSYGSSASFVVQHSSNGVAINNGNVFQYTDRWSERTTWGYLPPPASADIAQIPVGQRLVFDATEAVNVVGFLVQGELVFEDGRDYQISCNWILVKGGTLRIGSAAQPFTSNIEITFNGEKSDTQIPTFGNKVFAVQAGIVEIYGLPVTSWTSLAATAAVGSLNITVQDATGWSVNDQVVIASTDFHYDHYETANIVSIDNTTNTITLDTALQFQHYSGIETHLGTDVEIRAEVGLLTRNIRIQGSETSELYSYGAHMMIAAYNGNSSSVTLSNVEFYRVGQRGQKNRFPVSFYGITDASSSLLDSCSIHHSYNRGVRLYQTNSATFQNNVLFDIQGHGFILETSTEVNNIFDSNLLLNIQSNYYFETTDVQASAFYITNPSNYLTGNRAAGSAYYGFHYNLVNSLPLAGTTVDNDNNCPVGIPLGSFLNNIAHSNAQEGLIISTEYTPRTNPCSSNNWVTNPAITARFEGFLGYKHSVRAVYAERIGDVRFEDLVLVDNGNEGIFIRYAGSAPDNAAQINAALIVGQSQGNAEINYTYNTKGISVPASENFLLSNTNFSNFDSNMAAITTCNGWCYDGESRTVRVHGLAFENVTNRLLWRKTAIFLTEDTTLSGVIGWSIPNHTHNLIAPACAADANLNGTITCDDTVTVRRLKVYTTQPSSSFVNQYLNVLRLDAGVEFDEAVDGYAEVVYDYTIAGWVAPFVLGHEYHIHWQNLTDFTKTVLNIEPLRWNNNDSNIVIHINHTAPRELFDVLAQNKLVNVTEGDVLDVSDSSLLAGNYTHNNITQILQVVVNNQNNVTTVELRGITCRYTCPPTPVGEEKDGRTRRWSVASDWDNNNDVVPVAGDAVVIESTWTMVLDTDTADLASLEINGDLIVLDPATENGNSEVSLSSQLIWVHAGRFIAGNDTNPYTGSLTINILGSQDDIPLIMGSSGESGNKILAVTGQLALYGNPTVISHSRLTAPANKGSSVINLEGAADLGLSVGDNLVISPTGFNADEFEIMTVQGINDDEVTLTSSLAYDHFGGPYVDVGVAGTTLDHSARVGRLSRNIRIVGSSDDSSNWGARIYVTDQNDYVINSTSGTADLVQYAGVLLLDNVELVNLGQDSSNAGIFFDGVSGGNGSLVNNSALYSTTVNGWNVYISSSINVTLNNNIFVNALKYNIAVIGGAPNQISNNLIIGTQDTGIVNVQTEDLIASVYVAGALASVTGNIVAGSEGVGFVLTADNCGSGSQLNGANNANSAKYGFIFQATSSSTCINISNIQVFSTNQGGLNTYASTAAINAQYIIATDNKNGSINLNIGGRGDLSGQMKVTLSNSYIGGTTLNDRLSTTFDASKCAAISGIRIPLITQLSNDIPFQLYQDAYWTARDESVFEPAFETVNLQLASFNDTRCDGLVAIETNPTGSDASAVTKLSATLNLTNVAKSQFIRFNTADSAWVNAKICGNFECTGLDNVLVKDTVGAFDNQNGTYVPNIPGIVGNDSDCQALDSRTAFCNSDKYGVLSFESLDSDKSSRIIAPVSLTNNDTGFNNTLNAFRDHTYYWYNQYSAGIRLERFVSLLRSDNTYVLNLTGTHPDKMHFKFLGASRTDDYVIIRTQYETPLVVNVQTTSSSITPNTLKLGQTIDLSPQKTICGVNNYYRDTRVVEFLINGNENCEVILEVRESLFVTVRYQTTVDAFFSNNGPAAFVDKLAALLGIHPSNIRVVNVVVGSAKVQAYVMTTQGANANQEVASNIKKITNGVNNGNLDLQDMSVLDFEYAALTKDSLINGEAPPIMKVVRTNTKLSTASIVLIVLGSVAGLIIAVVSFYLYKRARASKRGKISAEEWGKITSIGSVTSRMEKKDASSIDPELGTGSNSPVLGSRENLVRQNSSTPFVMDSDSDRRKSEEVATENTALADNFLKDLHQLEKDSESPLFSNSNGNSSSKKSYFDSGLRRSNNFNADKIGEPKKKSQFSQDINEKTFEKLDSSPTTLMSQELPPNPAESKPIIKSEIEIHDLELNPKN